MLGSHIYHTFKNPKSSDDSSVTHDIAISLDFAKSMKMNKPAISPAKEEKPYPLDGLVSFSN